MKKIKTLSIVVLCMLFFGQVFLVAKEKEDEHKASLSLLIGYLGSYVEAFGDERGAFTYGTDISYNISKKFSAVLKYHAFSKEIGNSGLKWKQSFLNLGLRTRGVAGSALGGGLSFSSVEGLNGTGFYVELTYNEGEIFSGLNVDIVKIGGITASAFSIMGGYSFNF